MGKYYSFVASSISNANWMPEYMAAVPSLVAKHGGRYLAATAIIDRMEGDGPKPSGISILEWPSKEAAEAFFTDPDYAPYLQARLAGSTGVNYLVPSADDD
jgi:uncharacterized protein (DUF1330 family)